MIVESSSNGGQTHCQLQLSPDVSAGTKNLLPPGLDEIDNLLAFSSGVKTFLRPQFLRIRRLRINLFLSQPFLCGSGLSFSFHLPSSAAQRCLFALICHEPAILRGSKRAGGMRRG